MHLREIRIIAHITQMISEIMWRGYVQMISRDLSMPFKGFCITRKPEHHVPPGGTAAQRIRYLNRPYGRILKRRPEGRRFLGVLFGFLRRLLR